jgi:GNAT superfamily N-acetyltransferase
MAEEILNNDPLGILSKQTAQPQDQDPLGILKKKSTPLESSVTPLPSQDKFQLTPKPQDKFQQGLQFAQEGFKMPSADVQRQRKEQGYLLNTISALDRGFAKNLVGNPVKGLGTFLQGTTAKVLGGSGKGFVSEALIDFGDYFNKTIDELAPQDEEFKNTLTDQFAQAMGQFGSLVLTGGMAGAGAKAPALVSQALPKGAVGLGATAAKGVAAELASPVSISAGLSMGQSEFERAKEFGATDDQAFEAFYKNAAVGSILEKIPTMQFLKRFNQSTGGGVANFIKTKGVAGITGGLEEMSTEVLQQLYANKTAKDIYNINQQIFEGVGESGGIGFGVGFLINAMGANARLLKREGKKDDAKLVEDQIKSFETKLEQETKKADQDKIKINEIADKLERNELVPLDDIEFYETNKEKVDKTLAARKLEAETSAPAVIMPEENIAPEVVEPTRPAVIMPQENIPAETTVISPEQQAKGAAVIMPEANVAPDVAETVVEEEEVPIVKPEVKSKLESFKTKFAPQPKELSMKGIGASETRKINEEAKNVEPKDARGFALSWLATGDESINPDSLNKLLGSFRASLNVGKTRKTQEEAVRDYVNKEGQEIDKVADKIWDRLPEQMQNKFTSMDIRDQLEMVIAEYSTRKDAAKALIEYQKGTKSGQTIDEQRAAYEERTQPGEEENIEPLELKGGFVPMEGDVDVKSLSKNIEDKYNVKLDLFETDKDISLSKIVVPKETRGKGIGTSAMEEIIKYADVNNKRILLTPSTDFGGTSVDRLKEFYKGFGFVENKGKNKDFTTKETMYRNPIEVEETPFAIQEGTDAEVSEMQDIVKDYINEGVTSLSEIKKSIAKELGYNTRKLRQTIDDAYNQYTKTQEAAPKDVVGGVVGRIGNALKKMFGKDAQKPFIAKDGKAMQAKLDEIREDVKFQIAGGFRSTNDMPIAYRYDTDQVARERYDIPKLKQIGAGSDRVVFDLGDGKVLKVAKTPRGLEQNVHEGDYYLSGNIIPEVFERGLNYVVVEKIEPPLKATKGFDKLNDLLGRIQKFSQKDFDQHNAELQDIMEEYEMTDIFNYDLLWNDFKAKRNWGIKDGQPLHLDGGSFGGIQMLDRFKGQKPLSDPEFRDIYNKSKKAKIENKDVDKFTKFMATPDAEILGFTYNNRMYLNGSALNPNTPIHEAGHIWVEWTKTNDPKIYAKGMELVKDSPYYKKAKESKFYQEQANKLPEDQRADYYSNEALAMAIGDKGAQFVVESKKDAFKDWLKTLWNKIKSLTGFKDLTEEQFQNLTFEDFSKMAVKEVLGVENDLDKFQAARSIRKKKDFVKSKVRGEANKNAIDEFEVDDMIKLIKADYDLQTLKNIKNAVQERSAEEVLPSKPRKIREGGGERRRVEPRVQGEDVTREGKEAQPEDVEEIPEEIENVGIEDQDIDFVGITEEELNDLRESLGLPKYQGLKKESHEQLQEMAAKMVKKGFNIEKLYNKIRKGGILTNYENAFMAEYRAALDLELKNNPSPELLEKVKEFTETFQPAASRLGKALESLKIVKKLNQANTLSNFLLMRQEDKGFNLSEKLIIQESERFEKIQKAKENLQLSLDQDLENQLKAEAQKEVKAKPKKTSEEYAQERKEALAAAREAMRKIRTGEQGLKVSILGVNEIQALVAIAPHMNRYFKSIVAEKVSQGVAKLDDIVNDVYNEFKDIVDGLTKRDVLDVIAGKYNAKRKTENELNAGLRLLRREAKLVSDLEAARKNEEVAKTERELAKTSKRIQELEAKIKEVRSLNAMKEFAEDGVYEKSPTIGKNIKSDEYYDQKRQRFLEKKISQLEDDIKNKNYEKEVVEAPRPKSSDRTKKLEDKVIELQKQLAKDRLADQQRNLKGYQKAWDKALNILGVRRILQTSIDASIWLRQLAKISFNPLHYDITLKFIKASGQSVFSQKNYDRLMYKIKEAPDYEESVKDGIKYNDLDSQEQNEMFPKSFIFEIPVLREPLLASQRVADGSLNIARYELYNKYKRELLKKGITRESDPKMYEAMAKLVMNSTGSGNMLKFLETPDGQRAMGGLFYGAKLMAANFNTLNPVFYFKMPGDVQKMAWRDLAAQTSTVISVILACVAAGATVSLDPDDPDFLQVRFGKKVYDFTAGQAAYIRTFLRLVEAGYARATKSKFEASEAASFAWGSTLRFFRNKLAPNNAYLVNAAVGKNTLGEDFDPMEIFYVYPMYADDAYQAAKEDGFVSLLTVLLPNFIGTGYSSYYSDRAMKPLDEIISRAQNSDEVDPRAVKKDITKDEFKQYTKLRDQLIADKIKELYEQGNDDDVMVKDMTDEELVKEITKLKRRATTEAKKELEFDKEEE